MHTNLSNIVLKLQLGPTQYRSRTVFENVSPELLRDFFWDDEFRPKWDKMLIRSKVLSTCLQSGTVIVHWIRKVIFPVARLLNFLLIRSFNYNCVL